VYHLRYDWHVERSQALGDLAGDLRVPVADLHNRAIKLAAENKAMHKMLRQAKSQEQLKGTGDAESIQTVEVGSDQGRRMLFHHHDACDKAGLRDFVNSIATDQPGATHFVLSRRHVAVR
jgi:hypothetical protein